VSVPDGDGELLQVGWVYFEEASLSVHGILIRKGATVFTIEPTDSLASAAKSLTNHDIGALVVTDAEGRTVGIVSERDIVRALGEKESGAFETPVAEIMTRKVVFCSRDDRSVYLMQRMTDGKFRHLPVIEDGRLIGIVSIGDVVKSRLEELEQESDTLREYIYRRAHHKYD
jgi:CBS domain-containing protein